MELASSLARNRTAYASSLGLAPRPSGVAPMTRALASGATPRVKALDRTERIGNPRRHARAEERHQCLLAEEAGRRSGSRWYQQPLEVGGRIAGFGAGDGHAFAGAEGIPRSSAT